MGWFVRVSLLLLFAILSDNSDNRLPQLLRPLFPMFVLAQEYPAFNTTRWSTAPEHQHRTNVCERQRLLSSDKNVSLRNALQGLNLTVAITNYHTGNEVRFFTLSKEGTIKTADPGLFVVLLDEVARRAGFAWRNSFAAIDPLSPADVNKTWSDLLEWEVGNFDISVDYWGRSQVRMARGISFPKGWYSGSVILATVRKSPRDNSFSSFWAFLLPFDTWTWLCVLAIVILTGMSYFLLERLDTNSDEKELKPLTAIFLSSLTFTGHYLFLPNTHPARLLSFSWTFWCLIIMSAYTANLASFLVSRNLAAAPVSTLDDALQTGTPVCIQRLSAMDEYVSAKYPEMNVVRKDTEQELFLALRDPWFDGGGGCGVAMTNLNTYEIYQGQKVTNGDCALFSEKRTIFSLPSGFATAVDSGVLCTSLISYVLNLHLSEMEAEGFIDQAWHDHVRKVSNQDCSGALESLSTSSSSSRKKKVEPDNGNISLNLWEMAGIFFLHGGLTVLAVMLALFDLIKRFRNRSSRENSTPSRSNTEHGTTANVLPGA